MPRSRRMSSATTAPHPWPGSRSRSGSTSSPASRAPRRGSCCAASCPNWPVASIRRPMASADEVLYDKDADLAVLDGKTVAILGYGSQGHAHALNLKDSGVKVVVGLRPDSSSRDEAKGEGLEVMDVADAASAGDVVMILLPDEKQAQIWREEISDGIADGNLLMFAHGFA